MMDVEVLNSWLLYKQDHREVGMPRKNFMQPLGCNVELAQFFLASDKGFTTVETDCEVLQLRKPAVVAFPPPSVSTLSASHMTEFMDQKSTNRCRNPCFFSAFFFSTLHIKLLCPLLLMYVYQASILYRVYARACIHAH